MIIQAPYKQDDVISFKLISGEEMIARYVSEDTTAFKVMKPINLIPTPNGTYGMLPALISAELNTNSVSLQKSSVIIHAKSKDEVASQYIQSTTGIKPASSLSGVMNAQGGQKR